MKTKTSLLLVLGAALASTSASLTGCSNDSGRPGLPPPGPLDVSRAALRRAKSCEELTGMLRADARAKMNRRIDAEVRAIREGYTYSNSYGGDMRGGPVAMNGASAGASSSGGTGGAAPAPMPAHSETETQVVGVDEADIVKADGTRLFVLHGQKLLLVDAWPAPTLGVAGGTDIEGEPTEMYVANGKVVVFSSVDGTPIYTAAGQKPRPAYSDSNSGSSGMSMGGAVGGAMMAGPSYTTGGGLAFASPLTKVTVLAIDGASAHVTRELYFEGRYVSSRRVDSKLRIVLGGGAHGPELKYAPEYPQGRNVNGSYIAPTNDEQIAAWEAVRYQNEVALAPTTYTDWIPSTFAKDGGAAHPGPTSCTDFYVPPEGTTDFGMTQVLSIDLAAPADAPRSSTIVGDVATVYGDASSIVLAGSAYTDPWLVRRGSYGAYGPNGSVAPPIPVETMNFTHLHLFDFSRDPAQAEYAGSGTVPGSVKDQFALDQKDGRVRVTTTEQRTGPARTDGRPNAVSRVFVLENQQGLLTVAGDAGEIAPGEQLYATRYIGDKAYVVTWHVTDPLFVIDLANPHQPKILGELKIPGFSEYMHPLDDTHLLTIGRETDDTGHQHTNAGYWYGIAIQVFDVTDPLAPKLQHKFVYDGGEYATTEAAQNHKAFTYFDDRKLLAFPYVRQAGWGLSASQGPSSTLEVFHVDVATGIRQIGSVDHSALLGKTPSGTFGYCGGYYDGAVRRGVFFENVVYSISYGGIMASDVGNLGAPLSSLKLSAPAMQGMACGG